VPLPNQDAKVKQRGEKDLYRGSWQRETGSAKIPANKTTKI
jgi:hypothetical protein